MSTAFQSAKETEARVANEARGQEKDTYSLGKMQVEYDSIKRDIETDKTLFNGVLARLKETDLTKSLDQSMIKVVEGAVASYVPVRPDKQKMLAQWSLGGLALGLMLALGLHLMDSSFKTVEDVERALQLPVLSAVTVRKTTAKKNATPDLETIHQRHSPVSESFRTLRSSLILLGNSDQRRDHHVYQRRPGRRQNFLRRELRRHPRESGAEDRPGRLRPSQARHRGNLHRQGATLRGCRSAGRAARAGRGGPSRPPWPTLMCSPRVRQPPTHRRLLSGQSFVELLSDLRKRYDRIVVDSAPVLAVSDPLIIAPHADTICLVVRSHKTSRHSAIRACAAIAKSGKIPSGLVLNRLPISAAGYYYYYGSRYGQKKVYGAPA